MINWAVLLYKINLAWASTSQHFSNTSEKMDTTVFDFSYKVILNEDQGRPNWYKNVELSGPYEYTKFERN